VTSIMPTELMLRPSVEPAERISGIGRAADESGPLRESIVGTARLSCLTLATNGDAQSDGACRLAFAVAELLAVSINVLTVTEANGAHASPRLCLSVDRQMERVRTSRVPNGLRCLHAGIARDVIPLVVGGLRTDLLILGRTGDQGTTSLAVLRRTSVPVLCVDTAAVDRPRTILCAIDGTMASLRAAQLGVALLRDEPGTVICVHTRATHLDESIDIEDRIRAMVRVSPSVTMTVVPWRDGATQPILDLAISARVDVLTVGRRPESILNDASQDCLSAFFMRAAACSVLIAK